MIAPVSHGSELILEQVTDLTAKSVLLTCSLIILIAELSKLFTSLELHAAGEQIDNVGVIAMDEFGIIIDNVYMQWRPIIDIFSFVTLIDIHSSYMPMSFKLPCKIPRGIFEDASNTVVK